jgi:hypothetical protein
MAFSSRVLQTEMIALGGTEEWIARGERLRLPVSIAVMD